MAIRAIGFDFDNTLINFLSRKIKNTGIVFSEKLNVDARDAERAYKKFSGLGRKDLFNAMAEHLFRRQLSEAEYRAVSDSFDALNEQYLSPACLYPDTVPVLAREQNEGRILYLSSSVPTSPLKHAAQKVGIAHYFMEILGSDLHEGKGIGHIEFIAQKYGLKKEEIVHVGDELFDMTSAKAAGIYAVGMLTTRYDKELTDAGADAVIDNLAEIESALASLAY